MKILKYILLSLLLIIGIASCDEDEKFELVDVDDDKVGCELIPIIGSSASNSTFINSPTVISRVTVIDKCVILETSFSGGCEEHLIDLEMFQDISTLHPHVLYLGKLLHNNTDPCEAIFTQEYGYDLSSLTIPEGQVFELRLEGWDDGIIIQF